ncbi:hypothetical protein OK016_19955 [Vibrio chagasii]|nr:hypothetical protein [Vibrio chagasii]
MVRIFLLGSFTQGLCISFLACYCFPVLSGILALKQQHLLTSTSVVGLILCDVSAGVVWILAVGNRRARHHLEEKPNG